MISHFCFNGCLYTYYINSLEVIFAKETERFIQRHVSTLNASLQISYCATPPVEITAKAALQHRLKCASACYSKGLIGFPVSLLR